MSYDLRQGLHYVTLLSFQLFSGTLRLRVGFCILLLYIQNWKYRKSQLYTIYLEYAHIPDMYISIDDPAVACGVTCLTESNKPLISGCEVAYVLEEPSVPVSGTDQRHEKRMR